MKIFYSWQSDLDNRQNRYFIEKSIKMAISKLTKDLDLDISLEQDARDNPGSAHIATEIMKKIADSDIFIADISIVNNDSNDVRKMPNPNVLYELGYASSKLGWERIILVFNTNFGRIEELPFDIQGQKVMPYKGGEGKNISEYIKSAINLIITKSPQKEWNKKTKSKEEIKIERDVEDIKSFLACIHIETIDNFVDNLPNMIQKDIFYFYEKLNCLATTSSASMYDEELHDLFVNFWDGIKKALSYDRHYVPHGNNCLTLKFDNSLSTNEKEIFFDDMEKIKRQIRGSLNMILKRLKDYYWEIDYKKISEENYKYFLKYQKREENQ